MNSSNFERYSRNILLPEIGGIGQKRIARSKILIVGAGGLGAPTLTYLTASGIGEIGIIDFDTVTLSNLQRQVLFRVDDIGMLKVNSVESRLKDLNPNTKIIKYPFELTENNAEGIFENYNLILDGSDNFSTRYLVNKYCVRLQKPLLFGAINQWDGQISLYDPDKVSACYECIFPEINNIDLEVNCSNNGVLGPLVGIIGSLMAAEAIKIITNAGSSLAGELILYDSLVGQMRRYKTCPRSDCKICSIV
jgi:molybdopterin/thiamine biosynthesis adenylyltransferase